MLGRYVPLSMGHCCGILDANFHFQLLGGVASATHNHNVLLAFAADAIATRVQQPATLQLANHGRAPDLVNLRPVTPSTWELRNIALTPRRSARENRRCIETKTRSQHTIAFPPPSSTAITRDVR